MCSTKRGNDRVSWLLAVHEPWVEIFKKVLWGIRMVQLVSFNSLDLKGNKAWGFQNGTCMKSSWPEKRGNRWRRFNNVPSQKKPEFCLYHADQWPEHNRYSLPLGLNKSYHIEAKLVWHGRGLTLLQLTFIESQWFPRILNNIFNAGMAWPMVCSQKAKRKEELSII